MRAPLFLFLSFLGVDLLRTAPGTSARRKSHFTRSREGQVTRASACTRCQSGHVEKERTGRKIKVYTYIYINIYAECLCLRAYITRSQGLIRDRKAAHQRIVVANGHLTWPRWRSLSIFPSRSSSLLENSSSRIPSRVESVRKQGVQAVRRQDTACMVPIWTRICYRSTGY